MLSCPKIVLEFPQMPRPEAGLPYIDWYYNYVAVLMARRARSGEPEGKSREYLKDVLSKYDPHRKREQ
jgi:hypothetical protein